MSTETTTNVYDEVLENMRKAAEANLKMQQDVFQQWTRMWPGFPSPQTMMIDKVRDFQKQWTNTVSDLARKHRDTFDPAVPGGAGVAGRGAATVRVEQSRGVPEEDGATLPQDARLSARGFRSPDEGVSGRDESME